MPRRLSGARTRGIGLRLYGAAGVETGLPDLRHLRPARLPDDRARPDAVGLQLAAGQGKRDGPGASAIPPHPAGQRRLHRRFQDAARVGLDGDPGRHGLHRHTAAGRQRMGAGRRFHLAQYPSVSAERRPNGAAQFSQPAAGDDLGGAARRHSHDADRLFPRPRGQGHAARHRVRPGQQPFLRAAPARARRLGCPGQYSRWHVAAWAGASRHHRSRRHHDAQHDPAWHPRGEEGRGVRSPDAAQRRGDPDLQPRPRRARRRAGRDPGRRPRADPRGRAQRRRAVGQERPGGRLEPPPTPECAPATSGCRG